MEMDHMSTDFGADSSDKQTRLNALPMPAAIQPAWVITTTYPHYPRSTQPSTLHGTVKWLLAKVQWCCAVMLGGKVISRPGRN